MLGGSLTELMNHIVPYDYGYGVGLWGSAKKVPIRLVSSLAL